MENEENMVLQENKGTIDAFISYSTKNKNVADAIVANFEQNGVKCWYAPRDIMPGQEWVSAIKSALHSSKIFILIYTEESNDSRQVMNEVAMAFNAGKTIVPFRLTQDEMNDELEYYLTRVHWLDAVSKPMEKNINELRKYVEVILQRPAKDTLKGDSPAEGKDNLMQQKTGNDVAGKSEKQTGKKKAGVWIAAALAAVLLLVGGVFALIKFSGPNKDKLMAAGKEALYGGNYGIEDDNKARELFEQAAKKGVADAYYYLGIIDTRSYDYKSAKKNYEMGIEAGSNYALLAMGELYQKGNGVKGDDKKAWELYCEASDNGCVEADYYKAQIISAGLAGQTIDAQKALKYYTNVTEESKDPNYIKMAYNKIGEIYRKGGVGVEINLDEAIKAYQKVGEGEEDSFHFLCSEYNTGLAYQQMDEVVKAQEHFRNAFEINNEMAEAGYVYAMYWNGICYRYGKGVEKNYEKAIKWFERANDTVKERNLKLCCAVALYELGEMCEEGQGFHQDYEQAYNYYHEAAEAGYGEAAYAIGLLYHWKRIGADEQGKANYEMARQWYDQALEYGCTDAYNNIAIIYEEGLGKYEKDIEQAIEYYQKGAALGNGKCMNNLGLLYQGMEDYENAYAWYQKGAEFDNSNSMVNLGIFYEKGYYVGQSDEQAYEWYTKAADADNKSGWRKLGNTFYFGELSKEKDYEKALRYYLRGADLGDSYCMYLAGFMYKYGQGTDKNLANAKEWLTAAADAGNEDAAYELGVLLLDGGDGIETNIEEAISRLEFAAQKDHLEACAELGYDYVTGSKGIEENLEEGAKWLSKAADMGDLTSTVYLGTYYRKKEDHKQAFACFKKAAEEGYNNKNVFKFLGRYYYEGEVTQADSGEAQKWLVKAFEGGAELTKEDLHFLTFSYYPDNKEAAFPYAKGAAEAGDEVCMAVLGELYRNGNGTTADAHLALKWYGTALLSNQLSENNAKICRDSIQYLVDKNEITAEEAAPYLQ